MAVTNNFSSSSLDLNGVIALEQPTALVWGPDGRLYVTEVDGDVKVLTVAFGDKDAGDGDPTAQFYVTDAVTLDEVKDIPNRNDDGGQSKQVNRQVTGIDVTPQYDPETGAPVLIDGKPAVTMYVTSSDSRKGAGTSGEDKDLDTNSGVITKLTQTGPNSWDAVDLVRGLARSEENHALNGLEVIQTLDDDGNLVSERMIVANGGNANSGAPSNNFAGQEEQPYSGAILEVDLDALAAMEVKTDAVSGRAYVYDTPTLDDPTRDGMEDAGDPFGGNDSFNSAKLLAEGPIRIYSPGYRNAYDVEVTEDGRVFTYDNGANNTWGGRPIGEAGDDGGTVDFAQALGYIATNLNNGDGNSNDDITLVNWNPSNKDQAHEVTRSDDLAGRALSAGQGGATTYLDPDSALTLVYGGHPNPTRAEGSRAGLLFSPGAGTDNAFLLMSNLDSDGDGTGDSDYDEVIAWLAEVEADDASYPDSGLYGAGAGELTSRVLAVTPGVLYDIYALAGGGGAAIEAGGQAPEGGTLLGQAGLPSDIGEIVARTNPIEGNYLEAGRTDGAIDTGNGSINGMTEYTSTLLDEGGVKMSGALISASLGGQLIIKGRDEDGIVQTGVNGQGFTVAADRTVINAGGAPLGLASLGDDVLERGLSQPFQGSIWSAVYKENGPLIEIYQPGNGTVPLAGSEIVDETDADLDGVSHVFDPFEFSAENGYALDAGERLVLDFSPLNDNFPTSFSSTGFLGAALDGTTPNQDARTAAENFPADQQRDGLYDNGGNLLPGGNAPIFQIKKVIDGTVVGAANSARDAMQTGFRPADGVSRVEAALNVKNWVLEAGTPETGQLTGLMFGDGTQSNFLRVVFGGVQGVGTGIEVGYELGDAGYVALARVAVPGLSQASATSIDLRLEIAGIGQADGFDVGVSYRLAGQSDYTAVDLGGFSLPEGVLRDVLTGDHTITSGGVTLPSGAAVGILAEDVAGDGNAASDPGLKAIDFNQLTIEGFGNDIAADTAAEVGAQGTSALDTVVYTGTDTALAPLAANVENFDGRASGADYAVTGNALGNVISLGAGTNTVTTGGGADTVRGTLAQLAGDEITDLSEQDEVVIEGVSLEDLTVGYAAGAGGAAVVSLDGAEITFSGPRFEGFNPAQGAQAFTLEDVPGGVRLAVKPAIASVVAINAGGGAVQGLTVRDTVIDFVGDGAGAPKAGFTTTGGYKAYTNNDAQAFDFPGTDLDAVLATERSGNFATPWGYSIDVANGTYLVDLFYAEIYHGLVTTGDPDDKRQFDVLIEGALVEDDYDIIDDAGAAGTLATRSYTVEVTDGSLDVEFLKQVDQAKLSGLAVWALGGSVAPPSDTTPPAVASIAVANPQGVEDDVRAATVVLTDAGGFDAAVLAALDGSELSFSGIEPAAVSAPSVSLSDDGTTATLTYALTPPETGWPAGEGEVSVAQGAYLDAAGNASAPASGAFIFEPNLDNLAAGAVALAINVGPLSNIVDGGLDGDDKNTYGGAIANDPIIGVSLQADDPSYYSPSSKTGSNIDGKAGPTGSNPALDGSALHTYRDSAAGSFTATYPIENGVYVVELWFAELFHATPGQRQGDYVVNGQVVELNFDAHTAAGGADTAVKITKNVAVTDGQLVVEVNADIGQPGYNAIVVYEAVPSDLPPTISVGDASAVEGGEATVVFTRAGDLDEAVEVTFAVTPGGADASDYGVPLAASVTIEAGARSASIVLPIVDDEEEEGSETFAVEITGVSGSAVVADGVGVVTIAASDVSTGAPTGTAIFALDFETAGDPLAQGGFDGLLGGAGALEGAKATVAGGKLQVATSDGDLFLTPATASKNDFVRAADVSDAAIEQATLTTRFENPFDAAFMADRGLNGTVPNYLQQGIVVATGDVAANQDPGQVVKLIWGGNGGTVVQLWSQNAIDQTVTLQAMSDAAVAAGGAAFATTDVASVELALGIDKAQGTVAQYVTLFDALGSVLGGVRPAATAGFAAAPAQAIPPAVAAAIADGTSVFGVTSTDYDQAAGDAVASFPATWDSLTLTSPQAVSGPAGDAFAGTELSDFSDDPQNPSDVGTLALGDTALRATQQGDAQEGGRDYDYVTFTVAEGQVLDGLILSGFESEDPSNQGFLGLIEGATMPAPPQSQAEYEALSAQLLGGVLMGGSGGLGAGADLLGEDGLASGEVQGQTTMDFEAPLGAGTYTLWFSQGGSPSTTTLQFQVSEASMADTLSISAAPSVVEGGDEGATTLAFPLSAPGFEGEMTVSYEVDGVAGSQPVTFAAGTGTLSIAVPNDDVDTGATTVSVTLTGASVGGNPYAVDAASATAAGTVTEDDAGAGTPGTPGAVVFALNVGGGEVTGADGTVYAADTGAGWTGSTPYFDGKAGVDQALVGGDYDRDGDADGDDAPYATDRFGGKDAAVMTYVKDGLAPGDYVLTLKFAELYDPAFKDDGRVFDVRANGVTVADDLDLFDVAAETDQAYDVEVPVTVGADGLLTLEFDASVDNAKVNAIVLREAAATGGGDAVVTIAPGASAIESGDEGVTALAFDLATTGVDGTVTVDYTVDGVAAQADVAFAGGAGTLTVEVPNDDLASGDASVAVVLTGVSGGAALGAAAASAGTVTEDDFAPAEDEGIATQIAAQGAAFTFAIPGTAFADADSTLTYAATLADGGALPAWLAFDAATGTFSGTPGADDTGSVSVLVTASDGSNAPATTTFELAVSEPDNTAPTTAPIDAGSAPETADPVAIDLLANAADADGDTLGVTNVSVTDGGGFDVPFVLDGSTVTIDPAALANFVEAGESATVTVAYEVTDGRGGVAPGSATLVVEGVDGSTVWYLDADADGFGSDAAPTVTDTEQPDGYVAVGGDPDDADATVYPGAPEINDGQDNDGDGAVDEDNLAPTPTDDEATVASNRSLTIAAVDLLADDADPDGDALSVTAVGDAVGGTVALDAAQGVVTFTPEAGFVGAASFSYTVEDGFGGAATASVAVTVTQADDTLVETPLALGAGTLTSYGTDVGTNGQDRTGPEGAAIDGSTLTLLGNSWKAIVLPEPITVTEGMVLRFDYSSDKIAEIVGVGLDSDAQADNAGSAVFQIAGTQNFSIGDQTYRDYTTPGTTASFEIDLSGFAGQTFDRLVAFHDQDRDPASSEGTFANVRIAAPAGANAAPVAADDAAQVASGSTLAIPAADLLADDTDADGDALTLTAVSNATGGTVSLEGGVVTFTPADGFTGAASFDYTVSDGRGGLDTGTVAVTVTEAGGAGGGETATAIDFSAAPIQSYDDQDTTPGAGFAVGDGGASLQLTGNTWKKIALPAGAQTITEDTVLRFDMTLLGSAGEILGIGLETDNNFRNGGDALFQLAGRQNFGSQASREYFGQAGAVGETVSYEIDLGAFAGQSFATLVLLADDDRDAAIDVRFANVALVEPGEGGSTGGGTGDGQAPKIFGGAIGDQIVTEDQGFEFELPITDADTPRDDLVFTYEGLPEFVSTDGGFLSGTPANGDVGTYAITVTATDPEGNAVSDTFDITVENVNDAPEVTGALADRGAVLGAGFSMPLPQGVFTDVDAGDVLTYSATGLPEGVTIDPDTGAISGTPTQSGQFAVTVFASDGEADPVSTGFTLGVASGPPREEIVIEAEDFTGLGEATNFYGQFASSASGNQLIRVGNGQSGSVSTDLGAAGLVAGTYDLTVRAYDEADGVSTLRVLIDRGDGSAPELVGEFQLDATGLPGQGNATQAGNLVDLTVPGVSVTAGAQLILEGTAGGGEFLRTDLVRFTPVDAPADAAPTFASPAALSVVEGTVALGDVVASDPEGQPVSYAIAGGADAELFAIDAATGTLTFTAAPDFEAPADAGGNNVYDVIVRASDGAVTATQAIAVTVTDGGEGPAITGPAAVSAAENQTEVATYAAAAGVTFSIAGGADAGAFAIDPATGVLSFASAPDFEAPGDAGADGTYDVVVGATDADGTDTVAVAVTVTDANDAPEATGASVPAAVAGSDVTVDLSALFADQDGDALSYALVDADGSGLTLSGGTLAGTPAAGSYVITVSASDGGDAVETTFALEVTDDGTGGGTTGGLGLGDDLDDDGSANGADGDIDGDGIANLDDRAAYDATNQGVVLAGAGEVVIDFTALADGTSPFEAGFTGVAQTADGSPELDYATNNGAVVNGGRLEFQTTNDDTNNGDGAFTFLAEVGGDFTYEGVFDNPVFGTSGLSTFSQYGLIISMTGAPGASTGAGGDFVKLVTGNPGNGFEISGKGSVGGETKVGYPAGVSATEFAQVRLTLTADADAATLTGSYELLDGAGQVIGSGTVGTVTAANGSALQQALAGADDAVDPAFGVTSTDVGGGGAFTVSVESLRLAEQDGGDAGGGDTGGGGTPAEPTGALEAFAAQDDLDTSQSYGGGAVGAARLEIMTGVSDIDASNFGQNSFQVTNVGDKKISAIFIDVTEALYPDSVFDPDGKGGDNAAKPWAVNNAGGTGGYVDGTGYFLPGVDPLPNDTGTGIASNGGFKGAMVKFDATVSGGFQSGETVGFSGDMDPNSIAGLDKNGTAGVDNGATSGWDVGGISGHELIGSAFTVLFDDGTTATGELASDKSASGSHTLATQAGGSAAPGLTVGGVAAGGTGTYGGTAPSVIVSGNPGDTVRITLTKGLDPVTNGTAGIDALVAARLDRYDFEVSNNFDSQSVDVVIGADGTFDATGLFDYDDAPANNKPGFAGDDTAPIGYVASVINPSNGLPVSAVTAPVYLTNQGGPVTGDPTDGGDTGGGDTGGGGEPQPSGYWLEQNGALKVQFEDIMDGANPPSGWTYQAPGQGNGGAQGAHYYWGSEADSEGLNRNPTSGVFETSFLIEEAGTYTLRVRSARDTNQPSDARNDVWVRIDDDTSALVPSGTDPLDKEDGFVKLFGAGTSWGYSAKFDDTTDNNNPAAKVELDAGLHTIEFAGRSQGYHIDFFELSKGGTLVNAPNSTFVEGDPPTDGGGDTGGDTGGGRHRRRRHRRRRHRRWGHRRRRHGRRRYGRGDRAGVRDQVVLRRLGAVRQRVEPRPGVRLQRAGRADRGHPLPRRRDPRRGGDRAGVPALRGPGERGRAGLVPDRDRGLGERRDLQVLLQARRAQLRGRVRVVRRRGLERRHDPRDARHLGADRDRDRLGRGAGRGARLPHQRGAGQHRRPGRPRLELGQRRRARAGDPARPRQPALSERRRGPAGPRPHPEAPCAPAAAGPSLARPLPRAPEACYGGSIRRTQETT